jgi:hypothetical protein
MYVSMHRVYSVNTDYVLKLKVKKLKFQRLTN